MSCGYFGGESPSAIAATVVVYPSALQCTYVKHLYCKSMNSEVQADW
jgi:hypothetical protein